MVEPVRRAHAAHGSVRASRPSHRNHAPRDAESSRRNAYAPRTSSRKSAPRCAALSRMTLSPSLLEAWTRTVRTAPTARALIDAGSERTWTRAAINAEAEAWRAHYGAASAGQVVALAQPNGADWMRIFLGLLKCDAVPAPLDPGEPLAAQRSTAGLIGATALWRDGQLEPLGPRRRARPDRGRLIKLTSGSTGAPRPLCFTDAEMTADGRQLCAAMNIAEDDLNLGLIPWGHSYGLGNL